MGESIGFQTYTAKRPHKVRCALCDHRIFPGQKCAKWAWKDCADFGRVVVHEACNDKADALGVFDSEYGEFTPDSLPEALREEYRMANGDYPEDAAPCPCGDTPSVPR